MLFAMLRPAFLFFCFFFFNDTATTEIYTLSLHDALPISCFLAWGPFEQPYWSRTMGVVVKHVGGPAIAPGSPDPRSEEHTSELQSLRHLVCRLLLEKKKNRKNTNISKP